MASERKRKNTQKSAYGSGSIYPNKDGSFTIQIYLNHKLVRRRAPDREAAEVIRAELNRQKAAEQGNWQKAHYDPNDSQDDSHDEE